MSEILVDNLTGKTSAGDITVTSEGGAATQSLQQGLAKAWVNFTSQTTTSVRDSFNHSSITDNGTGDASITITSAMANTNFTHLGMGGFGTTSQIAICQQRASHAPTTTVSRYQLAYADTALYDAAFGGVGLLGDLA